MNVYLDACIVDCHPSGEFSRVVGRRQSPPFGVLRPPTPEERAWVEDMGRQPTRVPKGVFRYRSHAEANADWERWQADGITAQPRSGSMMNSRWT